MERKVEWFSQDLLSRLLNYAGFLLIFFVCITFVSIATVRSCSGSEISPNKNQKEIKFISVPKVPDGKNLVVSNEILIDLQNSVDSINLNIKKLNEIKSEIAIIEERNKDDMKFYLTILGAVFAIVGFFGFKSINDTRDSSIKLATDEARIAAKGIATAEAKDAIKIEHQTWTDNLSLIQNSLAVVNGNYESLASLFGTIGDLQTEITDLKIRFNALEGRDGDLLNPNVPAEHPITPNEPDKGIQDLPNEDNADQSEDEDKFADK